jgi:RNA polymerase sigma-70 factor (ECF subfamily)
VHTNEFGRVALPLMDALFRLARRLTGSGADAEDLVQQTYLKGFRCFGQLDDRSRCRAWMYRILRNLWLEQEGLRRSRPALVLQGGLEDQGEAEALWPAGDLEQELLAAGFSDEVEAALGALPETFRTVVLLADVEGLSYDDVAEVMGWPKGTVRSRLSRGRALLARHLQRSRRADARQGGA